MLVGNNANEGTSFTPQNITTTDDLVAWLRLTFPLFTNDDIAKILLYYPSSNASTDSSTPMFATSGNSAPSALNESSVGAGPQQRADVCRMSYTSSCAHVANWITEHLRRDHFCLPRLLDGDRFQ
jgi:hypothetical protein